MDLVLLGAIAIAVGAAAYLHKTKKSKGNMGDILKKD